MSGPGRAGDAAAAIAWLRTPEAIRERSGNVLAAGEQGALRHFAIERSRLDAAADYVIATMRANYPTLQVPPHIRWRHFSADGRDRWAALAEEIGHRFDPEALLPAA